VLGDAVLAERGAHVELVAPGFVDDGESSLTPSQLTRGKRKDWVVRTCLAGEVGELSFAHTALAACGTESSSFTRLMAPWSCAVLRSLRFGKVLCGWPPPVSRPSTTTPGAIFTAILGRRCLCAACSVSPPSNGGELPLRPAPTLFPCSWPLQGPLAGGAGRKDTIKGHLK